MQAVTVQSVEIEEKSRVRGKTRVRARVLRDEAPRYSQRGLSPALVFCLLSTVFLVTAIVISIVAITLPRRETAGKTAGWMYIADVDWPKALNHECNQLDQLPFPMEWAEINYNDTDILIIGPLGVFYNSEGLPELGLTPAGWTFNKQLTEWDDWMADAAGVARGSKVEGISCGGLVPRFEAVLREARRQRPQLDIRVSVWWTNGCHGSGPTGNSTEWGSPLGCDNVPPSQNNHFAKSARAFLASYNLTGLDVDYENINVAPYFPALATALHDEFDGEFKLSVSAAHTDHLRECAAAIDEAFLQTYMDGYEPMGCHGEVCRLNTFREQTGIPNSKLFYGLCPETNCKCPTTGPLCGEARPIELAVSDAIDHGFAGVHSWRLNSDNWEYEAEVMATAHMLLRPSA